MHGVAEATFEAVQVPAPGLSPRAIPAQVLPEGFALPALPYLLALLVVAGVVAAGLRRLDPALTERRALALVPWMVAGAVGHVAYVVDVAPAAVRPLLGTPSVYATAAVLAGATWLAAGSLDRDVARAVAVVGAALALPPLVAVVGAAVAADRLSPLWPTAALVVGLVVGAATWLGLRRVAPGVAVAGRLGALAVVGHALDGVSTAVGVDVLGFGERTPVSRLVIEFAAGLPTAPVLGAGWLFVVVKLAVAAGVVVLLADSVREAPREGRLLLLLVAAVGLGPGVHNLVLFAVA